MTLAANDVFIFLEGGVILKKARQGVHSDFRQNLGKLNKAGIICKETFPSYYSGNRHET